MNSKTCVICGRNLSGIWITHESYLEKLSLDKYKIGFQCQHCGTCICTAGNKKDHPYGKISLFKKEKFMCPECGEEFKPGHVILSEDAPVRVELRKMLGESGPTIEAGTYNQISGVLDKRKWRMDKAVREQLIQRLKTDGNGYIYRCLKELVWEIEKCSPSGSELEKNSARNRTSRVLWLAEIGADWLFEDGMAEEILVYIIENMRENIGAPGEHSLSDNPASILDTLIKALYRVETVTKSGKSIPALINTLHNDEVIHYRRIAAFALGFIDWDPRVVDALVMALNDDKRPYRPAGGSLMTPKAASVQERAVLSLIQIGDEKGLEAVIPVVGRSVKLAGSTDIEYSGKDSAVLLTKIGKIAPHLLEDALKKRDKEELRKDIVKNVGELTIINQVEKALSQIN